MNLQRVSPSAKSRGWPCGSLRSVTATSDNVRRDCCAHNAPDQSIAKGEQDGNRQLGFFRCLVLAVLSAILSAACWLLWLATPLTFGALAGFAGVALGIALFGIAETSRL